MRDHTCASTFCFTRFEELETNWFWFYQLVKLVLAEWTGEVWNLGHKWSTLESIAKHIQRRMKKSHFILCLKVLDNEVIGYSWSYLADERKDFLVELGHIPPELEDVISEKGTYIFADNGVSLHHRGNGIGKDMIKIRLNHVLNLPDVKRIFCVVHQNIGTPLPVDTPRDEMIRQKFRNYVDAGFQDTEIIDPQRPGRIFLINQLQH